MFPQNHDKSDQSTRTSLPVFGLLAPVTLLEMNLSRVYWNVTKIFFSLILTFMSSDSYNKRIKS